MATILAPVYFTVLHGQISGTGFAQAKMMASLAMVETDSGLMTPGPDRASAMQTSALHPRFGDAAGSFFAVGQF